MSTGEVSVNSLYGGANPLRHFQRFLNRAERKKGLLPGWWTVGKRGACERLARDKEQFSTIYGAMEKSDIVEHYNDPLMPMKLRV